MLPIFAERARGELRRVENLRLLRQRARIRRESNAFDLPDRRFIELFRLNKDLAQQLINLIRPHLPARVRQRGITPENMVLATLRFYATGSYQRSVGQDFNLGLSQPSICQCIHKVTQIIDEHLGNQFIKFPSTREDRQQNKADFMEKFGFPGVIGAIDCTHVAILKPAIDEHNFINRKGYHSLNVQLIVDSNQKILNINANFGGSTNDAFVWRNSAIRRFLNQLHNLGETTTWLIGDSGYPLQPFLMTPFIGAAENTPESRYNAAHIRARNVVERAIGVLKMRFRCLLKERVARYDPTFVSMLVTACSVLHNMCVIGGVPLIYEEEDVENEVINIPGPINANNLLNEGQQTRNNIVRRYFD